MAERWPRKWFPFIATLFFFIWFSNMIGYIPLPTNTEHEKIDIFGLEFPSFALYAATANISVPLVLTLIVWFTYHVEGIRGKGFVGYFKSWMPAGVEGAAAVPIFVIEVISQFVRIISLSVRLFANILAGHLLILFMGGGLAVLLGLAALGVLTLPVAIVFFLFEVGLIATLQAFIFATLTSIYLGEATAGRPLRRTPWTCSASPNRAGGTITDDGLKSIALGVGAGLGTIGPGIGVGYIFGKVIESVTRQPEMREEITSIQWLGFALTEAIVFYAFIFGLIAFFL